MLKVSLFQNDFSVSSILPKNEKKIENIRPNSGIMIPQVELFSFVFLAELRIPKSPFEIKGPLLTCLKRYFLKVFQRSNELVYNYSDY